MECKEKTKNVVLKIYFSLRKCDDTRALRSLRFGAIPKQLGQISGYFFSSPWWTFLLNWAYYIETYSFGLAYAPTTRLWFMDAPFFRFITINRYSTYDRLTEIE